MLRIEFKQLNCGSCLKRITLCSILLTMPLADVSAASDSSAALAQIAKALSQGDSRTAERLVAMALTKPGLDTSDENVLLLNRAKIDEMQERLPDALADLSRAIDSHTLPQAMQIDALLRRGLLLVALNRLDDAIEDYNAILAIDAHSWRALSERASAYHRQNHISEAQHDYLASLAAGSKNPEYSYFGLGQIAEEQGGTAAARGFYTKAVTANPKYILAAERLKGLRSDVAARTSFTSTSKLASTLSAPAVVAQQLNSNDASIRLIPPAVVSVWHDNGHGPQFTSLDNVVLRPVESNVQLGVWTSEEKAAAAWSRAVQLAREPLMHLSPSITTVDLPGRGLGFRLRVPAIPNATKLCELLKAAGLDCIPVK